MKHLLAEYVLTTTPPSSDLIKNSTKYVSVQIYLICLDRVMHRLGRCRPSRGRAKGDTARSLVPGSEKGELHETFATERVAPIVSGALNVRSSISRAATDFAAR